MKTQWIDSTKRKPKSSIPVLGFSKLSDAHVIATWWNKQDGGHEHWSWEYGGNSNGDDSDIPFWQPPPKGPKMKPKRKPKSSW